MTVNSTRIRMESLPGRAGAFILDVKEFSSLQSFFSYNFYESEESNENRFEITQSEPAGSVSSYVTVNFSKPKFNFESNADLVNIVEVLSSENTPEDQRLTFEKIVSENDLGGNFFTGISIGIPNETGELKNLTKEAASVAINATESDAINSQSTTEFIKSYSNTLKENGFNFSDVYKNDLPRFFESISNENLGREKTSDDISYLNYESNVTYYSSVLSSISADIINNSTSIFSNSVKAQSQTIIDIENNSRQTKSENNPLSNYYPLINSRKVYNSATIFDAIGTETNDFDIKNKIYNDIEYIGVVIKARVTLKSGVVVTADPKIIINQNCEQIFITNPPYGSSVGVRVAPLYAIKIPVYKKEVTGLIKTTGVIFVSGKGKTTTASAVDTIPPPPPQDLSFNLTNQGLEINWSLPFNKQRDISKFRIFKRNNKNEPFTLLKQIDFGGIKDKKIPSFLNETPVNADGRPVIKTYCIDRSFDQNSDAIYAVTCVDVHDLTSNYSEQIRVKINPVFNRLETNLFGRIGAYIQYPNMTMEKEVFEGVVKASGYQKAKIYFNPDFLRIYQNTNGSEENLLNIDPTDENLFKLSLINIDLQEQQNLDIIIGEKISISEFDSADSAIVKSFLDEDISLN